MAKFLVTLTHSQHMALIDLIALSLRCPDASHPEAFVDCSSHPTVETTPAQLLRLVSDAPVRLEDSPAGDPTALRVADRALLEKLRAGDVLHVRSAERIEELLRRLPLPAVS